MKKSPTKTSSYFFIFLFVTVSFFTYKMAASYMALILLAFFTALMFKPIYKFLYEKFKNNSVGATIVTLLLIIICLFIPILLVTNMIVNQSVAVANDLEEYISTNGITYSDVIEKANESLNKLPYVDIEITEQGIIDSLITIIKAVPNYLVTNFKEISGFSINFFINIVMFFVFLAGFIPNTDKLISYIKRISPLEDEIDDVYLERIFAMSKSMLEGTLLIAIVQSLLTAIMMAILGVPYTVFWTIIMIVLGIIPMVGTSMVAIPIGVIMVMLEILKELY